MPPYFSSLLGEGKQGAAAAAHGAPSDFSMWPEARTQRPEAPPGKFNVARARQPLVRAAPSSSGLVRGGAAWATARRGGSPLNFLRVCLTV
jgi:hypothetical protein